MDPVVFRVGADAIHASDAPLLLFLLGLDPAAAGPISAADLHARAVLAAAMLGDCWWWPYQFGGALAGHPRALVAASTLAAIVDLTASSGPVEWAVA